MTPEPRAESPPPALGVERCCVARRFPNRNRAVPRCFRGTRRGSKKLTQKNNPLNPAPRASPPQVGIAALFTAEVYAWFCVGEVVGRGGSLTGY